MNEELTQFHHEVIDNLNCIQEELKWFCKNSHLIKKEKEGNTNKLYVVE